MQLVGANPNPQVMGLEKLPGKVNYFLGNDPTKWRTNIPTYAKVRYQDVYPGIDLIYYGTPPHLEYDFIVAPGADPQTIKLTFQGADNLELDAQGDLVLKVAGGELRLHQPRIYQEINGLKQPIPGHYVLLDFEPRTLNLEPLTSRPQTRTVGFHVTAYDPRKPLIIDPVLSYSTYLGGSSYDFGFGIAVDAAGNAYVTGGARSPDFPTTPGAFDTTCGTDGNCNYPQYVSDAFVTKLNASGSALVYSTYLGGSGYDKGNGITVDNAGNAYVTGGTASTNFPITPSAFDSTCGTDGNCNFDGEYVYPDAFVIEVNSTGSALVYSTYLGGSKSEGMVWYTSVGGIWYVGDISGLGIAVDGAGNAYVTGWTNSTDFPMASPVQPTCGPFYCVDAFVAKIGIEEKPPPCPATAALAGAPQKETKLGVLYAFRDEVLAKTPMGQRYIELFYKHAVEGVSLLVRYPDLRARTRALLERFLPLLQAILTGQQVTLTKADLAAIEALLEAFAAKASPQLQADLKALQVELRQGGVLEQFGMRIGK